MSCIANHSAVREGMGRAADSNDRDGSNPHHAPVPVNPFRPLEIENCDGCCRPYVIDLLWRVWGYGLMCPTCCEQLREGELHS